jgi:hypothetical protein
MNLCHHVILIDSLYVGTFVILIVSSYIAPGTSYVNKQVA